MKHFFLAIAALGALCCVQSATHSHHDVRIAPRAPSHQEMSAQSSHLAPVSTVTQQNTFPDVVEASAPSAASDSIHLHFSLADQLPSRLQQPAVYLIFPSGLSPPSSRA